MTESTADKVINAWRLRVPKEPKRRGAYYRGISPLRSDANNESGFVLKIDGPEHGTWKDYPTGRTGSLYTLARELTVPLPATAPAPDSKRGYDDLADYAQAHGVSAAVFEAAGWQDTTHHNRKAIVFKTSGGDRWRFIDGGSPPYINAPGYQACWYGLRKAVDKAQRDSLPLVLCNGEASTIVAQHHGIPACAITSGEKRLPDGLLAELLAAWPGEVLLAYDCDDTGRRVAGEVAAQIPGSKAIDLALDNHGDLADFCRLWGADACRELMRRARRATAPSVMLTDRLDVYLDLLDGREVLEGKPLTFPLTSFHRLGGFAHIVSPGKIVGIVAPSGHGKTSMLETIADKLNRAGEGGMYYGPEWSDDEMLARRIQRYGGPSLDKLELHRLFMRDVVKNVPDDRITGQLLDPEMMRRARRVAEDIRGWRGQMEYYRQERHLERLLETMGRGIEKRRGDGEQVTFAVFDYAQILEVADAKSNDNFVEYAVGLIKQFVIEHNIVGFVGSQVTKSATAEAANGQDIGAHDANWLREDKFNLFITLRIITEKDARGDLVLTNRAIANVAKNSTGQRGQVKLLARFSHLTWEEKSW